MLAARLRPSALLAALAALAVILSVTPAAGAAGAGPAVEAQAGLTGREPLARGRELLTGLGLDRERLTAVLELVRGAAVGAGVWPAEAVPGTLLVTVSPGRAGPLLRLADSAGLSGRRFTSVARLSSRVVALRVPVGQEAAAAAELRSRSDVVAVEPDLPLTYRVVPSDPQFPEQWAHELTGIAQAWDTTTGTEAPQGQRPRIAIIDSGIVATHPDLAGVVVEQITVGEGEILPGAPDNDACQVGHGTGVAGIAAALGNNGLDVAGVTWGADLIDIAVGPSTPEGCAAAGGQPVTLTSLLLLAMDAAVEAEADVINLSLGRGSRSCPTALQTVVDATRAAGTVIVAASGNAGAGTYGIPDACNGVISVGAVGPAGPATYSSTSQFVDLTAPGGDDVDGDLEITAAEGVLTTSWWDFGTRTGATLPQVGTSFSAPYVAGVVALLRSVDPAITPDQVEGVLEATARDLESPGRDPVTGFGLVDPVAAVALVDGNAAMPAPEADPLFPVGSAVGLRPGGVAEPLRVSAMTGRTDPVAQAVAVSELIFPDFAPEQLSAAYAVLARADDFADALSGSPLGQAGPILFTPSSGPLAPETRAELQRILMPGSPVLVLGGETALPAGLDAEITALGFEPVRLAGTVREETAVATATFLTAMLEEVGLPVTSAVLANRDVWYDAIAAAPLAISSLSPILLSRADEIHPTTAAALQELPLERLYVVGGEVRMSRATRELAAEFAQVPAAVVLAGPTRDATAVAVAAELEQILEDSDAGVFAAYTVNLTRDDGFAPALAASPVLAGVLPLPLLGADGSEISESTRAFFGGLGVPLLVPGDIDLFSEAGIQEVVGLLETPAPPLAP